jgi:hypothetical protein
MAHLSLLSFTTVPQKILNPKLIKRQRLIERLEEQKRLAADPSYAPVVKRWKKAADGSKILQDHHRRLKPWWRTDADGNVVLTIKVGMRTLEFETGKAGIAVGAPERLGSVFDTLMAAAVAGELDRFLAASAEAPAATEGRGIPKTKKVA